MKCVQSSQADGLQFKTIELASWQSDRAEMPEISVHKGIKYQSHLGLGGAFTESAAVNYQRLSDDARSLFLREYFDPDQGSGYNIGRIHMNSCDFSLGNWACQETEDSAFSIEHYENAILPMIRDAQSALGKKIKLVISPWSPPGWMKTTGKMNEGGQLKPEYRDAWAQYYVKFIKALQDKGFEIWGLTVQNEPAAVQRWDSCVYSPEEERDFIRDYLGPALHQNGLKDIRVICWDHNREALYQRASVILSDPDCAQYVWGSGFHWYMDNGFDQPQAVHDAFPDKGLLFTEGCQEGGPHHGEWSVAERYGESIISDFNGWTVGWLDWNLLLDHTGGPNHVENLCSAPILSSEDGKDIEIQPSQRYLRLLSPRYIPEGSVRILSTSGRDDLHCVAFNRPDGQTVLVVMNASSTAYNFQIGMNGQHLPTSIPAHAMQTYLL